MINDSAEFEVINGIKCYSPTLAYANADYPADVFQFLYDAEETNFWFISRNRVIKQLFGRYIGNKPAAILEIGCGTGYVLKGLKTRFPNYILTGSEIHLEGIKFAQKRLPTIEFIQLDAMEMPFENTFEGVGAFDVLEHIEEDVRVMKEVYKALKPNGYFVISVPQYQWMWSTTDDIAFHKRRYSRKELIGKLENAGFEVIYIGSFVFALFPFMYISRFFKKSKEGNENNNHEELTELKINPFLNTVFLAVMKIDEVLIRLGRSLPFGGSLIAVARKKERL